MAKKVNKNMVGMLAVLGFILMTVAGVLMVWQLRETDPQRFVDLAEARAKESDWQQAQLYYSRAYQASQDPQWLVMVGEMNYKRGDEGRAVQAWGRAVTQEPDYKPALIKLLEHAERVADMYPSQQQWTSVLKRADALLAVDEQDAYGLYCKGRSLRALKNQREENEAEGLAALQRAVEIAPENVDYGLALANWEAEQTREAGERRGLARDEDHYARYEALVAANTEPGPDAFKIRSAYAGVLANQGLMAAIQQRRAEIAKQQAEDTGQLDQARARQERADLFAAESEESYAKALALLKEGVALAGEEKKDQAAARVRLADFRFRQDLVPMARDPEKTGEADELTKYIKGLLVEAIDLDPDGFEQYEILAALYQARERYADAIEVCDQRTKRAIGRTGLKSAERKQGMYLILLKAADMCLLEAGQTDDEAQRTVLLDQAQQYVEDAKGEFPGGPWALHSEGKILLARGKDLPALAKFEEADRIFLDTRWENKLFLATLYLQQGQLGAARQAIEAACKNPNANVRAWITASNIYLEMKDYSLAARAAGQALRRDPESRRARLLQAEAYDKLGAPDLVAKAIGDLDVTDPKNIIVQARALAREEKYAEALQVLTPVLEEDPTNLDAVRLTIGLHNRLDQSPEAKAVIERALAVTPDDLNLKTLQLQLETDLSPEERQERRLAVINGIKDAYIRALELAQLRLDDGQHDQVEIHLLEAERLLAERATPKAQEIVDRYGEAAMREILDKRFVLAFRKAMAGGEEADWSQAEQIAADAAKRNIDGVGGLTYYGRLQLFQDKPEMAADSFSEALEQQPNNSQTLTFLAQAYLNLKQLDAAREAFEQAVVINPHNGLAHKGLAMLASNRRDTAAFTRHLNACQQFLPNDSWVRNQVLLLGEIADPKTGIERRVQMREADPKDTNNLLRLGDLYAKLDPPELEKAQECMDAALEVGSEDQFSLVWTVSQFYRTHIDPGRGLEIVKAEVERQTDLEKKAAIQTLVGRYLHEAGQQDQADAAYLAAADIAQTLEVYVRIGHHFFTTRRMEPALEWFTKAMAKADELGSSGALEIRKTRIECLLDLRQLDQAMEAVRELETSFPQDDSIPRLQANIEMRQGEYAKAIASLTLFLEKYPDNPHALFRRAQCYARLAKWNLAIVDLDRLKARNPTAFELAPRKLLAAAYDMTNRFDLASSELEALTEAYPDNVSVAEALIALYRDHERFPDAERVATRLINRMPQNPRWHAIRAEISAEALRRGPIQSAGSGTDVAGTREAARVLEDLKQAARLSKFHPAYVAGLLAAYSEFGPRDQGLQYFEQTLPPDKRLPPAVLGYATLLAEKDRADEAVQQYRTAALLQTEGPLRIAQPIAEQAAKVFGQQRALELFRTPPEDERFRRANQLILAMLLREGQQYSESITILEELLQTTDTDTEQAELSLALAMIAGFAERHTEARRYYEQVLKLDPENWVALNNLAYLLSDVLDEHKIALPYAQKASELNPSPTVQDTLGAVLTKLGRYREAIAELSQVVRDDPKFVAAYYHLGEAYRRLGEFADAEHLLDEAQKLLEEARRLNRADHEEEYAEPISQALEKIRNRDSSP